MFTGRFSSCSRRKHINNWRGINSSGLLLALVALHGQVAGVLRQVHLPARVADRLLPQLLLLRLLALASLLLRHISYN